MTKRWKEIQLEIRRMYVTEGKPLKEVRAAMKAEHNFDASIRAYKSHFEEWGYRKNNTSGRHPATARSIVRANVRGALTRTTVASTNTSATTLQGGEEDKSRKFMSVIKSVSPGLGKGGVQARVESDRGSIKFLLNSGTASFIECFRLPSSHERRKLFNFRRAPDALSPLDIFTNINENGSTFFDPNEDEPIDCALFDDENLLRFLGSPFSEVEMQKYDIFPPLHMDSNFASAAGLPVPIDWELPSPESSCIIQAIFRTASSLNLSPEHQAKITHHLEFLFTPSRITRIVNLYFEFWHPHCPIVHRKSFSVETAPTPLLVAIITMSAMYSQVDRDVKTATALLDLIELYIYSMNDLTEESEIRHMLLGQSEALSSLVFQHLQAAYLAVCVQFWAGKMVARRRVIETRFGVVIKVARKLGLTKSRHELDDSLEECLWIQTESRIRLVNMITLLDCTFAFFANFPCRLTVSEMKFDLPSDELLFSSAHPFSEPHFILSRHITTFKAFQSLFGPTNPSIYPKYKKGNPLGLNAMDMFILIHLLYVHVYKHITLCLGGTSTTTETGIGISYAPSSDSNLALIKSALSLWRNWWSSIRSNVPNSAWADLGFFRNGYNYWLVIQLLVNNKASVDVMMGMEVGCEDALKQLKKLLQETGGDVGGSS